MHINAGDPAKLRIGGASALGTVAAWVYPDSLPSKNWIISYQEHWGFGFAGATLRYTRFSVADYTSNINLSSGSWQFAAVMVNGSVIRWLKMTAAGVVTTYQIGEGSGHHNGPYQARVGAFGGEYGDHGIAHVGVWIGQYLTDAELVSYARGFFPRQPTFYAPLWGLAYPEADLTPSPASLTEVPTCPVRATSPPLAPYLLAA